MFIYKMQCYAAMRKNVSSKFVNIDNPDTTTWVKQQVLNIYE